MLLFWVFVLSCYNVLLAFFSIPFLFGMILLSIIIFAILYNNKEFDGFKDLLYFSSLYTFVYASVLIVIKALFLLF